MSQIKCAEDLLEEEIITVAGRPYEIRSVFISRINGSVRIMALTLDESRTDFEIFLVFPPDALMEVHSSTSRREIIEEFASLVLHSVL